MEDLRPGAFRFAYEYRSPKSLTSLFEGLKILGGISDLTTAGPFQETITGGCASESLSELQASGTSDVP
jgi:hypothetical protein